MSNQAFKKRSASPSFDEDDNEGKDILQQKISRKKKKTNHSTKLINLFFSFMFVGASMVASANLQPALY